LVRHQHEGRAENNSIEQSVRESRIQFVEIEELNGDIGIFFKQFLACGDVIFININANDLSILEAIDNAVERMPGRSADIQHSFGFGIIPLCYPSVSCSKLSDNYLVKY